MTAIEAGKAFVKIEALDKTGAALNRIAGKIKSFGGMISNLGKQMIGAALPLAAGLGYAVKIFADFDDKMRELQGKIGASGAEFERLTALAKELGRTTSFTASQVASLMVELGTGGFNASQIEAATKSVLDLARATGTDAALSANFMISALNQFGLKADQSTRVADSLTAAANASAVTLESLGESLSYAGINAKQAGLSLEETLALLGALGNVGVVGSNAGTAIRRLATLSAAESDKMKEIFGVAGKDAQGNARNLIDVMQDINDATKDLGSGDRAAKFSEFFGLLGITGAQALSENATGVRDLLTQIRAGRGIAAETAKTMDAGIGGAIRRLLSALEGIAIAFGDAVSGPLMAFADQLSTVSAAITKFFESNKGAAQAILFGVAQWLAAGAALVVVGAAITGLGIVLGAVASTISAVGAALGFLLSPVGAVSAAIAGLAATWIGFTDSGRKFRSEVMGDLVGALETLKGAVQGIGDAIKAGDLELAFQIGLKSIEVAWLEATNAMRKEWIEFKNDIVGHMLDAAIEIREALMDALSSGPGQDLLALATESPGLRLAKWLTGSSDQDGDGKPPGPSRLQRVATEKAAVDDRERRAREEQMALRERARLAKEEAELFEWIGQSAKQVNDFLTAEKLATEFAGPAAPASPKQSAQRIESLLTELPEAIEKGTLADLQTTFATRQQELLAKIKSTQEQQLAVLKEVRDNTDPGDDEGEAI